MSNKLQFARKRNPNQNAVIGKNIKFHYKLRHILGLMVLFATFVYVTYSFIDIFFVMGFEPIEESKPYINRQLLEMAVVVWVSSMVVAFGFFDAPMRAKFRTWF